MEDHPFLLLPFRGNNCGLIPVYINRPGYMTKIAAMPIYGKNLKNLLQNQKSYDLETWHVVSGTQALQRLYK